MYKELFDKFSDIIKTHKLSEKKVSCRVLSKDIIRVPGEYALAKGKEVIVDCQIDGHHGQAFTDEPKSFEGNVNEVLPLVFGDNGDRAIFFATLNALLHYLGLVQGTVHCRNEAPEACGELLATHIHERFGKVKIAHIGHQPGHLKATAKRFDVVYVTDMSPENIGKVKFGVKVLDASMNEEVISMVDVACITGSTIVNGTFPELLECCKTHETKPIIYGVTIKGAANLLNFEVFCPFGLEEINCE